MFAHLIGQKYITREHFGDQQARAVNELVDFYTSGRRAAHSSADFVRAYSAALGDSRMTIGEINEAMMRAAGGWPTWILFSTFRENLERHYPDNQFSGLKRRLQNTKLSCNQ